jgi:hypothetical protein
MRELERHPSVLHLPAPHIWMLKPDALRSSPGTVSAQEAEGEGEVDLVVTLELHVRAHAGDDEILELTKWASGRCASALQGPGGMWGKAEVTVGVVRG